MVLTVGEKRSQLVIFSIVVLLAVSILLVYAISETQGNNSKLVIWDEVDVEGGNRTILIQEFVTFSANFTDNSTGEPISDAASFCQIRFNIGGSWTALENMSYNSFRKLYRFERQINASGNNSWNVLCNGSKSGYDLLNVTDYIFIAEPVNPVEVFLNKPLNQTTDKDGSLIFNCTSRTYNKLVNISLYNNVSGAWRLNQTTLVSGTVNTTTLTLNNIPNGDYLWSCLAYDNESFSAFGINNSFKIGDDLETPTVNLVEPADSVTDSDGAIIFSYNVSDVTSAIDRCSLIINGKINMTDSLVLESKTQFFGLIGLKDNNYTWSVNCTDLSTDANVGSSVQRSFEVRDNSSPVISLIEPENGEIDILGNVTFEYMVSDFSCDVSSCRLIIDDITNQTNTTITELERQNFTIKNLNYGSYEWRINCTDTSPNANVGSSNSWELIVNKEPVVTLNTPIYGSDDNDGDITFNYTVQDDGLLRNCTLYHNISGSFLPNQSNTFVQTNVSLYFTINNVPSGEFDWNVICYDDARVPNSDWGGFSNFMLVVDKYPPTVSTIPNLFWTEDGILTLNLSNYFSDPKGDDLTYIEKHTGNVTIMLNNESNIAVLESAKNWFGNVTVVFTTFDKHGMNISSNNATFTVYEGSDTKPRFILTSPANNTVDTDGYIFFSCNATDDYALTNMSLYFNLTGNLTLRETKPLSGLTNGVMFNVTNLSNGNYQWECVAKDNSSQEQWSDVFDVNVSIEVNLLHHIGSWIVNNINTSKYVVLSYSEYLNNSLTLGLLNIYEADGDLYYSKNMSSGSNFNSNYLIIHPQLINITPNEIFDNNFTVNNTAGLNFSIKYYHQGKEYETTDNITITIRSGIWI